MSKRTTRALIGSLLALTLIIGVLCFTHPFLFWYVGSPYKTQTILYRSALNAKITVEFQMQDAGALGYNRRVVQVTPGIFFDSVEPIDTSIFHGSDWNWVNEEVNELGLKGG